MGTKLSAIKRASLSVDLDAFHKLEPLIHTKGRLGIISVLAAAESVTFTELRDVLELTDGNLAAHLRPLQAAGYVELKKRGGPGKPVTLIALTAPGRAGFRRYLDGLEQIVKRHK